MSHDSFTFESGLLFNGSPCDSVGHDFENALPAYDFKGTLMKICPRPACQQVIQVTRVDDLDSEEWETFQEILHHAMIIDDDEF